MIMDLTQACATMRLEETAQLVSSARVGGLKSAFFQAAQQATFPFNLTGVKHDHAESTCCVPSGVEGASVLVVGDSISREIAHSVRTLGGNATYQLNCCTNLATGATRQGDGYYQRNQHWHEANLSRVVETLEECRTDALFLGGYGTWRLRKPFRRWADRDILLAPAHAHEAFIDVEMVRRLPMPMQHSLMSRWCGA